MSLVPYDSSDSETETEPIQKHKRSRKILLPPLSSYDLEEDFPSLQLRRVQGKTDLFAILPPPKHTVPTAPNFKPKILDDDRKEAKQRISFPDEEKSLQDRFLLKSLTDPELLPKPEVEQINATCKKKNHISYLVQKAKESEQEMKNQWAESKFARQQMRAKYGF